MAEENTQGEERTFTASELNAIITDRISEIKEKFADYEDLKAKASKYDEAEEASKSELQKVTETRDALQAELDKLKKAEAVRQIRESVANKTGVPASLLKADTEDECAAEAEAILGFAKASRSYPNVKDGGEVTAPTISKDDILSIKDERKRLEAIKQNISLFE
jgi:hypothetical protein